MPRRRRLHFPFVAHDFDAGKLEWGMPVTDMKYVKYEMGAQLAEANVYVLDDVITHAAGHGTLRQVADAWARLLVSPSLHTCKPDRIEGEEYLPRPFNRMAFNALADLLDYAVHNRQRWPNPVRGRLHDFARERAGDHSVRAYLVGEYNENDGYNVGRHPLTRAARSCACKLTRKRCEDCPDCAWQPATGNRPAGCVPSALVAGDADAAADMARRMGPKEWFAPDDAGVDEVDAGPMGRFVQTPGGFARKVYPRGPPRARRRGTGFG